MIDKVFQQTSPLPSSSSSSSFTSDTDFSDSSSSPAVGPSAWQQTKTSYENPVSRLHTLRYTSWCTHLFLVIGPHALFIIHLSFFWFCHVWCFLLKQPFTKISITYIYYLLLLLFKTQFLFKKQKGKVRTASDMVFHFAPAALPTCKNVHETLSRLETHPQFHVISWQDKNHSKYLQQTLLCFQGVPCWTVS